MSFAVLRKGRVGLLLMWAAALFQITIQQVYGSPGINGLGQFGIGVHWNLAFKGAAQITYLEFSSSPKL